MLMFILILMFSPFSFQSEQSSWVLRPNPEDRINRKPEDQIFDHSVRSILIIPQSLSKILSKRLRFQCLKYLLSTTQLG